VANLETFKSSKIGLILNYPLILVNQHKVKVKNPMIPNLTLNHMTFNLNAYLKKMFNPSIPIQTNRTHCFPSNSKIHHRLSFKLQSH
jgi:hypothetical protein